MSAPWIEDLMDHRISVEAQVRNYNLTTAIRAVHGPA